MSDKEQIIGRIFSLSIFNSVHNMFNTINKTFSRQINSQLINNNQKQRTFFSITLFINLIFNMNNKKKERHNSPRVIQIDLLQMSLFIVSSPIINSTQFNSLFSSFQSQWKLKVDSI
ncbi:hypothetical protein DMUE_6261 [Dictyocoela muelleri]|nr:hypothetical protein DMUE_6261 [Dictyocoela muelleri]